jgi:hypothetical protein
MEHDPAAGSPGKSPKSVPAEFFVHNGMGLA